MGSTLIPATALPMRADANPPVEAAPAPADNGDSFAALLRLELGRGPFDAASVPTVPSLAVENLPEGAPVVPALPDRPDAAEIVLLPVAPLVTPSLLQQTEPPAFPAGNDAVRAAIPSAPPLQLRERAIFRESTSDQRVSLANTVAEFAGDGKVPATSAETAGRISDLLGRSTAGSIDSSPERMPSAIPPHTAVDAGRPPATGGIALRAEAEIALPVGTAGWDSALAQKVVWMVSERVHAAELRLNPPHLGPIEVQLSMAPDRSGVTDAQFASPYAAVREAIEAAIPRLREALAESGITLGNAVVSDGSFQQQQQNFYSSDGGIAFHRREEAAQDFSHRVESPITVGTHCGLIDTFA